MKVIGQYRCGCSYGPINRKHRLKYCAIHGDDIQDEYPYLEQIIKSKRQRRQNDGQRKTN